MVKRKTANDVYDICVEIRMHAIKTNGKVMLNRWIATSALTVSSFAVAALVYVRFG